MKAGNRHCMDSPCGPYIYKHPDSYGVHAFIGTDYSSHEEFDAPPVQIGIWTQYTSALKGKTWSVYYDNRLVTRFNLEGRYLSNEGDIFIGGFYNNVCLKDAAFDNV